MKHLIIGNGIAGVSAAGSIKQIDPQAEITIVTSEDFPFYSRIRLIDYLSRQVEEDSLIMKHPKWYKENGIDLRTGTVIVGIDSKNKKVMTDGGEELSYDSLLLATGASSFVPPIPGADREGVFTLRTIDDARKINKYAEKSERVAIIGGGVLGLEVGSNLMKAGNSVEVIEFFGRLLPRQMDPGGAEILKSELEKQGFLFHLPAKTKEIVGSGAVEAVLLEDGSEVKADMVIISAGVRPDITLPRKIGMEVKMGLPVNDSMETAVESIYGAGDVAEHNGRCYGIWSASEAQGRVAGTNMAGGEAVYSGTTMANALKVAGVKLFSAGEIDPDGKLESIVESNPTSFSYKKMVISDNRIVGTILYGDLKPRMKVMKALEEKRDVSGIMDALKSWDLSQL